MILLNTIIALLTNHILACFVLAAMDSNEMKIFNWITSFSKPIQIVLMQVWPIVALMIFFKLVVYGNNNIK